MNKPTFKNLVLMNLQTLTNFPYIEEDFDALTDYGLLCKVVEYLNEVIANDNKQNDAIVELYNNFVSLKEYVDTYLQDMEEVKEEIININTSIESLTNSVASLNSEISNVKIDLTDLINTNYNTLKDYIDYNDNLLNEKITNIEIGSISVYNPTNGLLQPLQIVINDLYGNANKDGLTALEFDNLDLTATAFDAYQITAYEFDSAGRNILV